MIQCYCVFLSMQLTPLSKIKLSCYFLVLSFQNNKIVNLYLEKICFFCRFFPLSILLQLSSLWSLYDWLRLWVIIYHITCSCHAHILLQFYLLYLSIFIVIGVSSILPPGLKRFSQEIFLKKNVMVLYIEYRNTTYPPFTNTAFMFLQKKCDLKHPPGDEIYRSGTLSMFEVQI